MSWRAFSATNEPDTCLWCGLKLRKPNNVKSEREYFTPTHCQECKSKNVQADGKYFFCGDCQRDVACYRQKITEKTARYDKPGGYGDGFFCGLRCGYQWAVRFAELGKRLVNTERAA